MIFPKSIDNLVIDGSGQEFKGDDFRQLLGPGVYVIMHKDRPVYVGSGKRLLGRVGGRHHKQDLFVEASRILLFPCKGIEEAQELERQLINRFMPIGNQRNMREEVRRKLGMSRVSLQKLVQYRLANSV